MNGFTFAATPQLHFGAGKISMLSGITQTYGNNVLLVTGAQAFERLPWGASIRQQLDVPEREVLHYRIDGEPTPTMIDDAVRRYAGQGIHVVVAIGGGSVLDAGKAISAMLPLNEPVKDYLEGVGTRATHPGVKIPFIAVPTTAGTGSEATKNAVISEVGEHGYKRSLRHNNFVPDVALIDPILTVTCPPATTAASGMDAFTQLLESYLSTAATPLTDAWAMEGLQHVAKALPTAYQHGDNIEARSSMALAACLSGVTLANAGLGVVHGYASAVGGYVAIPHGVVCSTLMTAANRVTVRKLLAGGGEEALGRYAAVGKLFTGQSSKSDRYYIDHLLTTIETWAADMQIPGLGAYGVTRADVGRMVAVTDNKNNPVKLNAEELAEVLEDSL
ncbi:iron-containing alcohol dehydrogenase [Fulvivirgaceae bacterium PWU5]|uniref:Iron-containing alcohol dehydrogenase n=1 Tax=Dawidia cretensis TaxID=2782350 RepID=A0AAP2DTC4_9BACT|nr:iron-containing alcohol dehydrogenase [Dawidia cretensis]MBT1707165.1 iron-containing alcohol dehydrogenase [Dawidia cretensis]